MIVRASHGFWLLSLVLAGLWFRPGPGHKVLRAGSVGSAGSADQPSPWTSEQIAFVRGFNLSGIGEPGSLLSFLTQAPHPMGSHRQKTISEFLLQTLKKTGLKAGGQEFTSKLPKMRSNHPVRDEKQALRFESLNGVNVIGWIVRPESVCTVMLASHYDTKAISGMSYLGANDGASSAIGLLNLAGYLQKATSQPQNRVLWSCHLVFVWFDGEESVLPDWNDWKYKYHLSEPDHTKGSRYLASRMKPCTKQGYCLNETFLPMEINKSPVVRFILMDLIGSESLQITKDLHSDSKLKNAMIRAADFLGFKNFFGREQWIEDDHLPFARLGIPALNIIDFENLHHWHQESDVSSNVNFVSIKKASQLALALSLLSYP